MADRGHAATNKHSSSLAGAGVTYSDGHRTYKSPFNGDFMPKDRHYTPPKRMGEELRRKEWNQVCEFSVH
jgi:hypothetical protein